VPSLDRFDFVPGQFVSLSAELRGRRITRAYSICAPPSGNVFELCLNRVQNGLLSPYLFECQPGHEITMKGPVGFFTIRNPEREMIMLATGTGIAPFRAMIPHWLASGGSSLCTLIFGVRYEHALLYRAEWEALAAEHSNLRFWPVLSRSPGEWPGRRGHVQDHVAEAMRENGDADFYICGLKAMVNDARALLKDMGIERTHIFYEKYD
jgi:ferredoxin-NADP reductase